MDTELKILRELKELYPQNYQQVFIDILELISRWSEKLFPAYDWVDNSDVLMIAYGDSIQRPGQTPLSALKSFMDEALSDCVNLIHLLPICPSSSDDGFSVIDFQRVDPALGNWEDIRRLGSGYDIMLDAVINHVSRKSGYFKGYLAGEERYDGFFIEADPSADNSRVVRPRTSPLITPFFTLKGETKHLWTTFSDDQVDLNYKNPKVLLEILNVLLFYAGQGARFIRFDAIGFAWKERGTSCMNLPQVHSLVKLMRAVLESCAPGCGVITETNVPHRDNISYFGNGHDEAVMVYQFPLPPLVLFAFLSQNAEHLTRWAEELEPTMPFTAYLNFLASHDGIGLRPAEGILSRAELFMMVEQTIKRGGQVSCRALPDGSEEPYELNINYLDAVAGDIDDGAWKAQKFMASQFILLSMMGMPAIYYHSLLGSVSDTKGYEESGIKRRINRQKLDADTVLKELARPGSLRAMVAERFRELIRIRREYSAFSPNSPQRVLRLVPEAFALLRGEPGSRVLALVNVSSSKLELETGLPGVDLISGEALGHKQRMAPWQYRWIKIDE